MQMDEDVRSDECANEPEIGSDEKPSTAFMSTMDWSTENSGGFLSRQSMCSNISDEEYNQNLEQKCEPIDFSSIWDHDMESGDPADISNVGEAMNKPSVVFVNRLGANTLQDSIDLIPEESDDFVNTPAVHKPTKHGEEKTMGVSNTNTKDQIDSRNVLGRVARYGN